jgi:hypothetical protein
MEMERTIQQMLELLLAKQEKMLAEMKADRKADQEKAEASRKKSKRNDEGHSRRH